MFPRRRSSYSSHVLPKDAAKATDRKDLVLDNGFGVEFTLERERFSGGRERAVPVRIRERVYLVKSYRWEIKVQSPKDVVPA